MGENISIRIDGSVDARKRQDRVDLFQKSEEKRVALLSLGAASVAITLTASSTVWFTELTWAPSVLQQAEDRCHRMGQSSKVTCYYFIAKGTLDEAVLKLVEDKYKSIRLVSEWIACSNSFCNTCKLNKLQFVPTKDETMEIKEAEGKEYLQDFTDSFDQRGKRKLPLQSRITPKKKAKTQCCFPDCKKMIEGSFCNQHVHKRKKYSCSYGDCPFLVTQIASFCQNHRGVDRFIAL